MPRLDWEPQKTYPVGHICAPASGRGLARNGLRLITAASPDRFPHTTRLSCHRGIEKAAIAESSLQPAEVWFESQADVDDDWG